MVNKTFLASMDLSQRVVKAIPSPDEKNVKEMKRLLTKFWEDVKVLQTAFNSDNDFAMTYGILPFITNGDTFIRIDEESAADRAKEVF